jgi:hypothetical protein
MPRETGGPSPDEMDWKPQEEPQKIVPNYRRGFEPAKNPNFAGPNYEKRAETIQATLQQMDTLIGQIDDNLDSTYRNTFLKLLIGMKGALMDEYSRLAKPESYKDDPNKVGTSELHPATLDQFEQALASWGLEVRPRGK